MTFPFKKTIQVGYSHYSKQFRVAQSSHDVSAHNKSPKKKTSFHTIQCLHDGGGVGDCPDFALAMHMNPFTCK